MLGLEYLAGSLRKAGHDVALWDPTVGSGQRVSDGFGLYYYGRSEADVANMIARTRPECVGISCHYSFAVRDAYDVANLVKHVNPETIVVIGGLFVSIFHERPLLECAALDYGLIGEADHSLEDLLSKLSGQGGAFEDVDGLIYRSGGEVVKNKKCLFVQDLDSLPFPARDLWDMVPYLEGSREKRLYGLGNRPALSILTSRSCPNRCSYCNMWLVHGSRWRGRSAENVLAELDEILFKYKAEHVFVVDDNFTFRPERAKVICEKIIQNAYNFRWNTPNGISVKKIDDELAALMKKSGCANVCIAIESGSEYVRNVVMNKRISNAEIVSAVSCFRRADIPVVGFVLIGMPGEDEARFQETVKFLKSLPLASIVVSYAIPFPGTKLHDTLRQDGVITGDFTIGMDDLNTPVFTTRDFTKDDLVRRKAALKDLFPSLAVLTEIEARNGSHA
ncbi:MAG: radical SAM protein [Nitrospiraceae bacterium]|nr:radical SAM protein [Nitrospiraceae bacterium]